MTVEPFTTTGDGTWQAPAGVSSVTARCWGGGGAGGGVTGSSSAAGGGAGGTYSERILSVTAGNTYNLHVATTRTATETSSAATNKGDVTWFLENGANGCVAIGGTGAAPVSSAGTGGAGATASTTSSVGDTIRSGGDGGNGDPGGSQWGGGGGGGAGTTAAGGNATDADGGVHSSAGTGGSLSGGNGADGIDETHSAGGSGSNYGGGGGGGVTIGTQNVAGGTGAQGRIELEYTAVAAIPHKAYLVTEQAVVRSNFW